MFITCNKYGAEKVEVNPDCKSPYFGMCRGCQKKEEEAAEENK